MTDTNFDERSKRFQRNIYASAKGEIRLAVLQRDFDNFVAQDLAMGSIQVLDAGAGQGQFSMSLAKQGASVFLCDISRNMLQCAQQNFSEAGLTEKARFANLSLQELRPDKHGEYPLVLCHAVSEWLAEPEDAFKYLLPMVAAGGYFSLIFYNFHGLEYKNLLRTNFKHFNRESFSANRGSLTPINPLTPDTVLAMAESYNLTLLCKSGIRVFHDYIFDRADREREPDTLIEKELQYSQLEPFWRLARYVHFLFKKTDD